MTTTVMREKLHDYINDADDKRIASIYVLFEKQLDAEIKWHEDDSFVAELEDHVKRYEDEVDPGHSIEDVKASLNELRQNHLKK